MFFAICKGVEDVDSLSLLFEKALKIVVGYHCKLKILVAFRWFLRRFERCCLSVVAIYICKGFEDLG